MRLLLIAILTFHTAGSLYAQPSIQENITPLLIDSFAAKISRQPAPQIIDARSAEEYALNHITGAMNLNLQSENHACIIKTLVTTQPVFIYSIGNGRSAALAKELRNKGFIEVYELAGGIASWVGAGVNQPGREAALKNCKMS